MPDKRRHRGPHPQDAELFAPRWHPALRAATAELGWLLGRSYAVDAALKLVGDHHQLQRRQRLAVVRSACSPGAAASRRAARRSPTGASLVLDGFNVLISVEAALGGGLLLRGADGRLRDLASVHGTYRSVEETAEALDLLQGELEAADAVHWVLDRPVSNSGRLAERLRARGWTAELADQADQRLLAHVADGALLVTADGPLLDRALALQSRRPPGLADVVAPAVARLPGAWVLDLAPLGD